METNRLKQTISNLYSWELRNYILQECINSVSSYAAKLGGERRDCIPPKPIKERVYVEVREVNNSILFNRGIFIGAVLGFIGGIIIGPMICGSTMAIIGMLIGALIGLLLSGLIGIIIENCIDKEAANKRRTFEMQAEENYQRKMREYKRQCDLENERLIKERWLLDRVRIAEKALRDELQKSQNQLQQFYDQAEIEDSYRGFVQIGYMKELLKIEAATKLKGLDGLYYLVRKELRMDNLENILNGISARLDTIITQQNRLYGELLMASGRSDQLKRLVIDYVEKNQTGQQIPISELMDRCGM